MATGYSKSYNRVDDEFIEALDFNNEYEAIEAAFNNAAGHNHDGSGDNGGYIPVLSDLANNNEILVDGVGGQLKFSVNDTGVKTEQIRITNGTLVPSLTNDIDLGTVANKFKNLHIAGTATLANLVLASGATVTGILDDDTMVADSATALVTQQSIKAYADDIRITHAHDGTDGTFVELIASPDNLNVVEIDDVTNAIVMSVDVGSVKTNKLKVDDSGVYPVANLGLDLGLVTNKFNNFHAATVNATTVALSGTSVTDIFDENGMTSDSDTALATQQSIKAYADDSVSPLIAATININSGLGTVVRVGSPGTAKGVVGDLAGQIATNGTYVFLCHTNWTDGVADIWHRAAVATW